MLIGNVSVTNHCIPTISIAQTKFIEVRKMLEYLNNTNVPDVLKLQASEVGSAIQKYPKKAPNPENCYILATTVRPVKKVRKSVVFGAIFEQ